MDDLLNSLEKHCVKHLEEIDSELNAKGHFVCASQIDDMKDLLCAIKCIRQISAAKRATL